MGTCGGGRARRNGAVDQEDKEREIEDEVRDDELLVLVYDIGQLDCPVRNLPRLQYISAAMCNSVCIHPMSEMESYPRKIDLLYEVRFSLWCRNCLSRLASSITPCVNENCDMQRLPIRTSRD